MKVRTGVFVSTWIESDIVHKRVFCENLKMPV